MTSLPHSNTNWRTPRVRITDITPVVLRLPDGDRHQGKLETLSLTGGLLSLPHTLNRGARISLMFLTSSGPVLGTAEMLSPVSTEQQPFRFVALDRDVQHRLNKMVQPLLNPDEDVWIAKYRAAPVHHSPMRRVVSRIVLGSLSLVIFLLSAAYVFHVHFLR